MAKPNMNGPDELSRLKAAIKAGRDYPPEHVKWLVDKLMELPDITVCPHGRPVAMELTRKNLDYQFERS